MAKRNRVRYLLEMQQRWIYGCEDRSNYQLVGVAFIPSFDCFMAPNDLSVSSSSVVRMLQAKTLLFPLQRAP